MAQQGLRRGNPSATAALECIPQWPWEVFLTATTLSLQMGFFSTSLLIFKGYGHRFLL